MRKKRKKKMNLYIILGFLCLAYFIGIILFAGTGSNFYLIWGGLAAALLVLGFSKYTGLLERRIPVLLRRGTLICVLLGTALFIVVEAFIISGFFKTGEPGLDYIIVLGAQVRENGPSRVLKMRLDKAYAYLAANEETIVIVSGGQGSNEPETEAACMKDYLVSRGIGADRILLEDRSTDTSENLSFSLELIEGEEKSVGIVSNNFHIFRSVKIAQKLGYHKVEGIAATADPALLPNNMFREFFGVMKDFLMGNM